MTLFKPFDPNNLQSDKSRSEASETLASAQKEHADVLKDQEGAISEVEPEVGRGGQDEILTSSDADLSTKFADSLGRSGG
ncbi:MAG: hypothetical protein HC886_14900 [Leptolyngbyaceae cyanobacterium SM1_1_3]|nr:hypothetical protein [Leptolyngbyaceae cyanobacterium SM1_1_3]NJN04691.1 hypothetical protein [Leptolyngbyaceae cyanobacterium RM1_1_2]NJO11448.1 hypothetical protein [Leptolyngbyaceae cyanobacterium SL_1_1]